MEFIQSGFKRKKICIYGQKGTCSQISSTVKLFVSKPDDAKQLDAKMQNLLYLTSGGGIWTRSERRVRITGNCRSAKAGSPTLEGSPPLRTSNGINSQGVLLQLCMQPGRGNNVSREQVGDGTKPEVLLVL